MKAPKELNQNSAYLGMDLHDPVVIKELGLKGNKTEIANRKAIQRIYRLIPDEKIAAKIIKKKFDSAHKITSISKQEFIAKIGKSLDTETATKVYDKAKQCTNSVMKLWGTVNHLSAPHFKALRTNTISPEVNTYFEKLPGYQEIFGNLNYCDCSECKSIFGAAAYFVDLLRLVDTSITSIIPKDSPMPLMSFSQRRPDLKQIPLTCQKTNETVPYAQIVNERLRAVLALSEGLVDDQLDKKLSERIYPFELPFHLPLEKIRNGLGRLGTSYSEVIKLFAPQFPQFIVAEKLGFSIPEWEILRNGIGDVSASYGVKSTAELNDVETFCQKTGLTIHQVGNLFNQNLSEDELEAKLNVKFFINKGLKSKVPIIIGGEIKNLSDRILSRINPFLRLAKKLNWSFTDLNWAIFSINKASGAIDNNIMSGIADIKVISKKYQLSVLDVCVFLFDLKTFGCGAGSVSEAPFDQVFNTSGSNIIHPKYAGNTMYTDLDPDTKQLIEWDLDDSSFYASWIAAGVGLREADLKILVAHLNAGDTFTISVENLSSVYRHARLSQILNLKIEDYLIFLKLFGYDKKIAFTTKELTELLEFNNVLKRSGLHVRQLNYFIDDKTDHSIQPKVQDGFLDKWFASLKKLIDKVGRILAPAAERIFLTQLSSFLNTDKATLKSLLEILGYKVDLGLIKKFIAADKRSSKTIIDNLSRWLVLSKALRLTTKDLASIAGHKANYFKSGAPDGFPTSKEVLELFLFKEAQKKLKDRAEDLLGYMEAEKSSDKAQQILSGFSQLVNKNDIELLLGKMKGISRIKALQKIINISKLSSNTGAGMRSLIHLAKIAEGTSKWADFVKSADNVLALVRARHQPEDWPEIKEQIDGEIGVKLRTALLATALVELPKIKGLEGINSPRSLYEYLLIDVEMGDCSRISYIKEGLNAVQLYLHRCREQLEPGQQLNIPEEWWKWILNYRVWEANRKFFLYPENYLDPSIRQSKTQLFKELEDSLQQGVLDKENIEKAFLKYLDGFTELGKLVYVDAYYHDGSKDSPASSNTIYFFARTSNEPYQYYYLTWQAGNEGGDVWSEWKKINIPINATHITPIYSFGRLFLFWVERQTIKDTDDSPNASNGKDSDSPGNKKVQVEKATIKYSFYNFNKDWVQPQTLTPERIISVSGAVTPDTFGGIFPPEFFDMKQLVWNKVYCLKIPASTPGMSSKAEKLVVLLGPMLSTDEHRHWNYSDLISRAENSYLHTLETWLLKAANSFKTILSKKGNLPVFPPIVLENDLEANFLVKQDETIFLPNADPKDNFFAIVTDGTIPGQVQDDQVISDNYNYSNPVGFTPVFKQFFELPDELQHETKPTYFHAVSVYDKNLRRDKLVLLASGNKSKDQASATYFSQILPVPAEEKTQWSYISDVLAVNAFRYDYLGIGKATDLFLYNSLGNQLDIGTIEKDNTFTKKLNKDDFGDWVAEDRIVAMDYNKDHKLENLLYYRPGTGKVWLYKIELGRYVFESSNGIGGYDVESKKDRIIAFDYEGDGFMDDLVIYRPGKEDWDGYLSFVNNKHNNNKGEFSLQFSTKFGFFGYPFNDSSDRVIAFDFSSSGKQDHLLIYRKGTGKVWIFKNNRNNIFSPVFQSETGVAGYELKEDDRIIAYDHDNSGKQDHLVVYNSKNADHILIFRNSVFNKKNAVNWLSAPVPSIPRGSQTLALTNHPAAFVYRGDKEAFLMLDRTKTDPTISSQISLETGALGITNLSVKAAKPNPNPKSYKFEATRLTTAAVHRLSSTLFIEGLDALMSFSSQDAPTLNSPTLSTSH